MRPLAICVLLISLGRAQSVKDWCDCGAGLNSLTVWPEGEPASNQTLTIGASEVLIWSATTTTVNWRCDGMTTEQSTSIPEGSSEWSVHFYAAGKPFCSFTGLMSSGRINWTSTAVYPHPSRYCQL